MTLTIHKGQKIAGYEAHELRRLFRKILSSPGDGFTCVFVARTLHISNTQAQAMIIKLIRLNYFQDYGSNKLENETFYRLTEQGRQLARASAAARIPRFRAEIILKEFMSRVSDLNADEQYAYRVSTVIVFGSYLTKGPNLGDVDIAIELTGRAKTPEEVSEHEKIRRSQARQRGRQFPTFLEELCWPQTEIRLFLRNRRREISLHDMNELIEMTKQKHVPHRILLGDEARITRLLSHRSD